MQLRQRILFTVVLLVLECVDAATIQKRGTVLSPAFDGAAEEAKCRTWRERLRQIFWRPDAAAQYVQPATAAAGQPFSHNLSRYVNDVVLRFNITGHDEAKAMAEAVNMLYLDVWSATKDHVDIRMQRGTVPLLLDLLPESMHHSHSALMHNIAQEALETYPGGMESPVPHPPVGRLLEPIGKAKYEALFFQDYRPLNVVVAWMKLLESLFSAHVRLVTIGKSFEGRNIHALKVGAAHPEGKQKKAVIITGAAHAREWITVSTVSYLAYSMITGFSRGDKGIDNMVNQFDWIFLPTLNVDGYAYTWEQDRLWRKNRQPTSLSFCKGIDLDRAYNFHFDDSPQSSSNPCSEMFPGGFPFQAQEAKEFAHWAKKLIKNGTKIVGLLDMHSYSQQILYPYSYSCSVPPPDLENLEELGMGLAKAIRLRSGEHYDVTSACSGTGFAGLIPGTTGSGSMLDYFYGKIRVPFTYQIKLRDTGSHGFLLPKENIVPTGEEMFSMLKYFSQFLLDDGSPTLAKTEGSQEL